MLKIGGGTDRREIARALREGDALTITYDDVLSADDVRETIAGIRDADSPIQARPLLAWLASHPSTPEDLLREIFAGAPREVLVALAMNVRAPEDVRRALLESDDEDVASYASKTFGG